MKPKLYILDEATINLYPSGPDGRTVIGSAIWIGACAERLTLNSRLEAQRFAATGARYQSVHHIDETHQIQIERLWVLRREDLHDYKLQRNQRYVMEIVWVDETQEWAKRTYYGVTANSYDIASNSIMEFMAQQSWDAEYYEDASGLEAYVSNPQLSDDEGTTDQVLFVHEEPIIHTDPATAYMTAVYRWPENRVTISAKIIGRSGVGNPSDFTLEINGSLTAYVLTLPLGDAPGDEVQNSLTFETVLPANQDVRWKCTSGPTLEASGPYAVAIVMTIKD